MLRSAASIFGVEDDQGVGERGARRRMEVAVLVAVWDAPGRRTDGPRVPAGDSERWNQWRSTSAMCRTSPRIVMSLGGRRQLARPPRPMRPSALRITQVQK